VHEIVRGRGKRKEGSYALIAPQQLIAALAFAFSVAQPQHTHAQEPKTTDTQSQLGFDMSRSGGQDVLSNQFHRLWSYRDRCFDPRPRRSSTIGHHEWLSARRTFIFDEMIKQWDARASHQSLEDYLLSKSCTVYTLIFNVAGSPADWPPWGSELADKTKSVRLRPSGSPMLMRVNCYVVGNEWGTYWSTFMGGLKLKLFQSPFAGNRFNTESFTLNFDDSGQFCGFDFHGVRTSFFDP
jgi:hypothetical protein